MSPITIQHLTLRTALIYIGSFLLVAALVLYVTFQARFMLIGPTVTVYTPAGSSLERTVTIEGTAQNIVGITLNDRTIYTDERGYFKETLVLENGYTIATVRAKDRYGRMTTERRSFVYTPLPDNS